MKTVLVTGSAGFIGFFLCTRLLKDGFRVIGLDAMTDYYDVRLKERRQQMLLQHEHFRAINDRIEASELLITLFLFLTAPITALFIAKAHIHRHIDKDDLPQLSDDACWAVLNTEDPEDTSADKAV